MTKRIEIVTEARKWLGTPYRHQGRIINVGVDCAGLILGVCAALGIPATDMEGYSRRPDGTLRGAVHARTLYVESGQEDAGDVVVFHWNGEHTHLGLLTSKTTIIHAFAVNRKVVEHNLDDKWRRNITSFRKLHGVE